MNTQGIKRICSGYYEVKCRDCTVRKNNYGEAVRQPSSKLEKKFKFHFKRYCKPNSAIQKECQAMVIW